SELDKLGIGNFGMKFLKSVLHFTSKIKPRNSTVSEKNISQ
ncbi:25536_t:CDS:1, partial [Racocetra persica]